MLVTIEDLSQISLKVAKPHNQLLQNLEGTRSQKKKFKVHWGPEQQEAFETLQRLCTESPVLAYADFKAPFCARAQLISQHVDAGQLNIPPQQ